MTSKGFNNLSKPTALSSVHIKVSLCMIVKNEAERLANCLKSVKGFVDEIILVDTGSRDRTVNIAKKYGAKIFKFEWCDDFAAARNYSLEQARGEWILVLDADEVLVQAIIPILQNAINNPEYLAINLNREEIGAGRSPYSLITRLFRRRLDIYFTGFYHESIDNSVEALMQSHPQDSQQVITIPQVAIHHYGYKPELLSKKQEFAQRLMEKQLAADPNDAYTHSKLGALYVEIGAAEQGLSLLQTGLSILKSDPQNLPTQFELNYHLGIAYSHIQNWELAKTHYQNAIALDVADVIKLPAYNNLGNLWQSESKFAEAIACYEKILDIAPDFATGYFNLGIARKSVHDFTGAIAAYIEALKINPQYAEAYQNLAVALQQTGKIEASKMAFTEAIKYHRQQDRQEIAQQLQNYLSNAC
ncbi:glycosyl transferase [Synechococcus sp. PCC 7502]|uniref:glycosyltransferase n=1 Tax=Synechococcus sp. PCC 7502 TaxID=1173263 RepID=UPI00029FE092|nr:glycosyltransferase family 2 protein [Synechococcus sp. PCC 7502]AFY74315.1 glycosyl transferase [Synechococcus sp. PCC 7502]